MPIARLDEIESVETPQANVASLADIVSVEPPSPPKAGKPGPTASYVDALQPEPEPGPVSVDLNLDEQGVPLPSVDRSVLGKKYNAPEERTVPRQPSGPGMRDVALGAQEGIASLATMPMKAAESIYPNRLASGRTMSQAAEEQLGPDPEEIASRQTTGSKIIRGLARAPFDLAKYGATTVAAGGNPVLGMAAADAMSTSGVDRTPEEAVQAGAKGAVMGAALGPLGRYGRAVRIPANAAMGAGLTAAEGGDVSDIVASGAVMGTLGGLHGKQAEAKPEPRMSDETASYRADEMSGKIKRPLDQLMEEKGIPTEQGERPVNPEVFKTAPETRPEIEERYAELFNEAEKREATRQRRAAQQPPEVPETGIPEGVARGVDSRQRLAQQLTGKPWEELGNSERLAIDDLIIEGYSGAGGVPSPEVPPVIPASQPPKSSKPAVPAPALEQKPPTMPAPEAERLPERVPESVRGDEIPPATETPVAPPVRQTDPVQQIIEEAPPATSETSATAAASAGGGRFGSERGSFSLKSTAPPLTPTEQYAKDQVAARESARRGPIGTFIDRVKEGIAKVKAEGVDSTAPILDALKTAQKEHGFEVRPTANIDYAIDRVYRANSLAEQFIKDKGLDKLIRDVEDIDYLDQYLIAKHALDVGAHGFKTGRDVAKDVALINDFKNRKAMPDGRTYDQVAREVTKFSEDVLDYSVESGLVSKDLAFKLKTMYKDYVPLTRIFSAIERGEFDGVQGRSVSSLSKQTVVQKLQGSEREIENPLYSLLEKARIAFSQGERNKAAAMLAGYRELPGMGQLIREAKPGESIPANRSFTYLDAGRKRTFDTTPAIASAAKSLEVHSIGILGEILGAPGRLMKIGTTGINLPFVVSNVAADQLHTLVTSRYERSVANPGVFFKALMAALKHDDLWNEVVRSGAGFTSFDQYRGQPKSTIDKIRATKDTKSKLDYLVEHPISSVGQLFRATEDIVSRSEEFGRARLFAQAKDRLLKQGRTPEDARVLATLEANNALPNYMRAGNRMRPLNAVIPYLNAGVQGVRSFTRSMEKAPVKTSAAIATTLYFPVAMATLWNLSDPDRKKAYADIEPYELDNNIVILLDGGGTKDKQNRYDVLKFKLPPGLNQLTIPLRRALESAHGLDPVKFSEVASSALGSVSVVEPNWRSVGSTLMPQAIKPTFQAIANYDLFRDRPKVPRKLQDLPVEQQVMPYTSGTAKKIAGALGTSPIKTEEFIKDTMGGIGSQVLSASDRLLNRAGVIPKEDIGGTSTVESVTARLGKARGGNTEHKVYEQRAQLEQDMSRLAVKKAKASPYYQRIKANEELAQEYLNTVATRAKGMVDREFSTRQFKKLEADQKLKKMAEVRTRLMRIGVPASIVRASVAPAVPPSRQDRYAIPTPVAP
jgi:hypothetical protein